MRRIYWCVLIGIGILWFLMPILKLEFYVASAILLLVYTLIFTRKEGGEEDDSSKIADLTLVEKTVSHPGNLNLEGSIFKAISGVNPETGLQKAFEKTIRSNINGYPVEKSLFNCSKTLDKTTSILMKLISSLFAKDAIAARKILGSYVTILRENEILKNERRNMFSEARFRARIMLIVSAILMGFLSAVNPVINMSSLLSPRPSLQQDPSQLLSLFLYLLSVSILVHRSLAYRKLAKTILCSVIGFTASFLLFSSIVNAFIMPTAH